MVGKLIFPKKTLRDVPLDGKTVLVRADYNVPLDETGKIGDDYRLRQSVQTIRQLIDRQCRIIVMSHLGRPDGKVNPRYSLAPVADRLSELLALDVSLAPDCVGDRAIQAAKRVKPGEVLLLENLRFHPQEEANDHEFAKQLATASGADYFVQDGFGVVHRAHASTDAITHFLPAVAGLLLEKEWRSIRGVMDAPDHPLVAILGGAKISDKIKVIEAFVEIADTIIIGGAMANTFLKYKGFPVGLSKVESDVGEVLDRIYAAARARVKSGDVDEFIVLPQDVVVAPSPDAHARRTVVSRQHVRPDEMILDIGSDSAHLARDIVSDAATVVWNGTLGYAELPQFAHGSARMALALAMQKQSTTTIIGGGDTADFVIKWDDGNDSFSHISTGGGASLELMAAKKLPGIEALMDAQADVGYTNEKRK